MSPNLAASWISPRRCGRGRSLRPASSGRTVSLHPPPGRSSSRSQCSRSPKPSAAQATLYFPEFQISRFDSNPLLLKSKRIFCSSELDQTYSQTFFGFVNTIVSFSVADLPEVGDGVRQRALCGDVGRHPGVVLNLKGE